MTWLQCAHYKRYSVALVFLFSCASFAATEPATDTPLAVETDEQAPLPTAFVEITRPIFLIEGAAQPLAPGFYQVTLASEQSLHISGDGEEPLKIAASKVAHDQTSSVPAALLIEGDDQRVDLALVLADGQAYVAAGSYTGVITRSTRTTITTTTTIAAAYSRYPTLYYECPETYRFRGDLDRISRSHNGSTWTSDSRFYIEGKFRNMSTGSYSGNNNYVLYCSYELNGSYFSRLQRDPLGPSRETYSCSYSNSTRRFTCTPR